MFIFFLISSNQQNSNCKKHQRDSKAYDSGSNSNNLRFNKLRLYNLRPSFQNQKFSFELINKNNILLKTLEDSLEKNKQAIKTCKLCKLNNLTWL